VWKIHASTTEMHENKSRFMLARRKPTPSGAISVAPTLRKVREGWGTRGIVMSMKGWLNRLVHVEKTIQQEHASRPDKN
jgi:hypothetical protein